MAGIRPAHPSDPTKAPRANLSNQATNRQIGAKSGRRPTWVNWLIDPGGGARQTPPPSHHEPKEIMATSSNEMGNFAHFGVDLKPP